MEAIKNLIEKYRYADKKYQIIIPVILGLAIAYYYHDTTVPQQEEVLEISQKAADNAKAQYSEAAQKKEKIKQLESDLERAEILLADLTKRLPNEVDIDLVLDNLAKLAIRTEINISSVEPQPVKAPPPQNNKDQNAEVKSFTENVVNLSISGRFKDTVRFFDELLHLEKVVNLNNIKMAAAIATGERAITAKDNETPTATAKRDRENAIINTTFEIITFRSAT